MRRRQILAALALLGVLALAGCSQPGSMTMDPVDDEALGREATMDVPTPRGDAPERARVETRAIREAIENGSTTVDGRSPPVDDEELGPYRHDGAVWELSYEAVDSHEETGADVRIDYAPANGSGPAVAYEDLPAVDRERLAPLFPPEEDREEGWDVGVGVRYDDAEAAESVLVGGPEYRVVTYDGERYRIDVETEPVTVTTYRYVAEELAPSVADFGARLAEEYAFTLEGLSEQQRSVVESALDGGYTADDDGDSAFEAVIEEFRSHEAYREDEYEGRWIARYQGETYWVEIQFGQYADT